MPKLKFSNATFLVIFKHCAFCRIKSRLFKLVTKSYWNGTFSRHLSNTVLIKYHHHHWWIFFLSKSCATAKGMCRTKKMVDVGRCMGWRYFSLLWLRTCCKVFSAARALFFNFGDPASSSAHFKDKLLPPSSTSFQLYFILAIPLSLSDLFRILAILALFYASAWCLKITEKVSFNVATVTFWVDKS